MSKYPPLNIKRTINAPIDKVWQAWTEPSLFSKWYMPAPFTVADCQFELKPGGVIKITTKDPSGGLMDLTGEFNIVEEPTKLVMINSPLDDNGNKLFTVRHSLTLKSVGVITELDLTSEVLNAGPNAEQYLSGMSAGLTQALEQLNQLF